MIRVALKPFNHPRYFQNGIFDISKEPRSRIFVTLREYLLKRRYSLTTIDMSQAENAQAVLVLDVPYPWDFRSWEYILKHIRNTILFQWEPPIINPFNYMPAVRYIFKNIYTFNDMLVDGKKYKKFYYPKTNTGFVKKNIPFSQKKLITMVASNLSVFIPFQLLSLSGELYSLRQRIVQFLDMFAPQDFDLYGKGWNKPRRYNLHDVLFGFRRYKTYKGECDDQYEVLSRYRFALCLENVDLPGYVCEKMFDCMKAGSVPIYLGASNITEYVPKGCFIDLRDFLNYHELLTYLRSVDVRKYEYYRRDIQKFLDSREARRFFEEDFAHQVYTALEDLFSQPSR